MIRPGVGKERKGYVLAKRKVSASLKPKPDDKRKQMPRLKPVEKEKVKLPLRIRNYFRDVKQEMSKVMWPERQEVIVSTAVVLVTVMFFAAYIGALDFVFGQILKYFTFGR